MTSLSDGAVSPAPASDRRWIIRLTRVADGATADETMWYGGYGGPTGRRIVRERDDAHAFDNFPNAVVNKENLLALGLADEAEIIEL